MEPNSKPPIKKYPLSDIEVVVISTKELEARLVNELFAPKFKSDKTLSSFYDKQKHVEHLFSTDDIEKFKYISNVRNILVHKVDENRINDRKRFEMTISDLNKAIDVAKTKLRTTSKPQIETSPAYERKTRGTSTGCFIATAVYGDYDHYKVKILRDYRDEKLLTNSIGQLFVRVYYKLSPPIAFFLQKNKNMAKFVGKILDRIVMGIKKSN